MKWFEDINIAKKLFITFTIVAIMGVVIGGIGIINIIRIDKADTTLYEEGALGLNYAGSAAVELQQVRYDALKLAYLDVNKTSDIDQTVKEIEDLTSTVDGIFSDLKSTMKSQDVLSKLSTFETEWESYKSSVDKFISYKQAGDTEQVIKMIPVLSQTGISLRDHFVELFDLVANQAQIKSDSNTKLANTSIIGTVIVIVIAFVMALLFERSLTKMIAKPIVTLVKVSDMLSEGNINTENVLTEKDLQLKYRKDEIGAMALSYNRLLDSTHDQVQAANRVSQGDLTTEISVRSEEDMLGKSLSTLVKNLNGLVASIVSTSDQVATSSSLVSDSSISLSQGATEQASSVEELTASLEQVSSQTQLNAQNADKANELSQVAKTNADTGNAQMQQMLQAMDEINQSSTNISKIIKVIDDIAFQTNILALNAAVEAARAGQHGKGFAVVAEEVRTLAARSANAAKETTAMIEGSIDNVKSGMKIANDTAKALGVIVEEVDKAAELVNSIAVASKEQALGIEQINQGIMQVSQVVQTNAATSEESAAASEELSAQAANLKELVSIFKLKKAGTAVESKKPEPKKGSPAVAISEEKNKAIAAPTRNAGTKKPVISLSDQDFGKY